MAKREHEPIHGLSERKATKQYMQTLGDVYRNEGVLAAAGYEIKSTFYSLGKRIANLFEGKSDDEKSYADKLTTYATSRLSYHKPSESLRERAVRDKNYRKKNQQERIAQRHGYILREKKHSNLENTAAITSILFLLGSIFFTFPNITGNVVASLPSRTTNRIGAVLFIIGIIGAFFCFRRK